MKYNDFDTVAMGLSAALILLGTVVLGIVEVLAGEPYGAAPLTNEAGEIVATPAIDPAVRTGLVIAGLLVLALWAIYRIATPAIGPETTAPVETTAD